MWKLQETATINLKISLLNTDGTPATGETTNLFTKIIAPSGEEVTGYTEAIFTEPASASNAGVYNVSFSTTASNKTFTLEDQANPYNVLLDSSTADVNPTTIDVWISSIYPWETAKEASLTDIKGGGWSFETLEEIMVAIQTRLASAPYTGGHAPATVTVNNGNTLSGDVSSIQTLNQEYLKVQETGKFQIDTTYTAIDEEHATFYVTYRYFGSGSSNHKVEARIWNYTGTPGWDEVVATTKDFPATEEDRTLVFTIPGNLSDYYDGSAPNLSAKLRIEHDSNFDAAHFFWLDTIGFGSLETIYTAPDNAGIATLADLVDTESHKIISLIESHRGHHTATGNIFYWNPINGHDENDGLTPVAAKLTYSHGGADGIHGLLTASNHDLVIILPGAAGSPTEINEYVEVDTGYTFIRGMGRDIFINATHDEVDAVLLSAEGVEFGGIRINTKATGSQNAIRATGDFAYIREVWVDYARSNGIIIDNASECTVDGWEVKDTGTNGDGYGCVIKGDVSSAEYNEIKNGISCSNDSVAAIDGIRITGAYAKNNTISGSPRLVVHGNTGWGIHEVNSADYNTVVGPTLFLGENTLGTVNLTGANSTAENVEQWGSGAATQLMFDEIKGDGWTDETLKTLKEFVDDLETRLTQNRADGMPPATMGRV